LYKSYRHYSARLSLDRLLIRVTAGTTIFYFVGPKALRPYYNISPVTPILYRDTTPPSIGRAPTRYLEIIYFRGSAWLIRVRLIKLFNNLLGMPKSISIVEGSIVIISAPLDYILQTFITATAVPTAV
jgi:hypothetical protein